MNDLERIHAIVDDLDLPAGQWAVVGSGVMYLHGITAEERGRPMGDLDIFCATRLWFDLLAQRDTKSTGRDHYGVMTSESRPRWGMFTTDPDDPKRRCDPPFLYRDMHGLPVHVFFEWRTRGYADMDVNDYLRDAPIVDGVPAAPLRQVLDWKVAVNRGKDQTDIALLRGRMTHHVETYKPRPRLPGEHEALIRAAIRQPSTGARIHRPGR